MSAKVFVVLMELFCQILQTSGGGGTVAIGESSAWYTIKSADGTDKLWCFNNVYTDWLVDAMSYSACDDHDPGNTWHLFRFKYSQGSYVIQPAVNCTDDLCIVPDPADEFKRGVIVQPCENIWETGFVTLPTGVPTPLFSMSCTDETSCTEDFLFYKTTNNLVNTSPAEWKELTEDKVFWQQKWIIEPHTGDFYCPTETTTGALAADTTVAEADGGAAEMDDTTVIDPISTTSSAENDEATTAVAFGTTSAASSVYTITAESIGTTSAAENDATTTGGAIGTTSAAASVYTTAIESFGTTSAAENDATTTAGAIDTTSAASSVYTTTTEFFGTSSAAENDATTTAGAIGSTSAASSVYATTTESVGTTSAAETAGTTTAGAIGTTSAAASVYTTTAESVGTTAAAENDATTTAGVIGTTSAAASVYTTAIESIGTTSAAENDATTTAGAIDTTSAAENDATTTAGAIDTTSAASSVYTTTTKSVGTTSAAETDATTTAGAIGTTSAAASVYTTTIESFGTSSAAETAGTTTAGAIGTTSAAASVYTTITESFGATSAAENDATTTAGAIDTTSAASSVYTTTTESVGTTSAAETDATTTAGAIGTTSAAASVYTTTAESVGTTAAAENDATTTAGVISTTSAAENDATTTAGDICTTSAASSVNTTTTESVGTTAAASSVYTITTESMGTTSAAENDEATTAGAIGITSAAASVFTSIAKSVGTTAAAENDATTTAGAFGTTSAASSVYTTTTESVGTTAAAEKDATTTAGVIGTTSAAENDATTTAGVIGTTSAASSVYTTTTESMGTTSAAENDEATTAEAIGTTSAGASVYTTTIESFGTTSAAENDATTTAGAIGTTSAGASVYTTTIESFGTTSIAETDDTSTAGAIGTTSADASVYTTTTESFGTTSAAVNDATTTAGAIGTTSAVASVYTTITESFCATSVAENDATTTMASTNVTSLAGTDKTTGEVIAITSVTEIWKTTTVERTTLAATKDNVTSAAFTDVSSGAETHEKTTAEAMVSTSKAETDDTSDATTTVTSAPETENVFGTTSSTRLESMGTMAEAENEGSTADKGIDTTSAATIGDIYFAAATVVSIAVETGETTAEAFDSSSTAATADLMFTDFTTYQTIAETEDTLSTEAFVVTAVATNRDITSAATSNVLSTKSTTVESIDATSLEAIDITASDAGIPSPAETRGEQKATVNDSVPETNSEDTEITAVSHTTAAETTGETSTERNTGSSRGDPTVAALYKDSIAAVSSSAVFEDTTYAFNNAFYPATATNDVMTVDPINVASAVVTILVSYTVQPTDSITDKMSEDPAENIQAKSDVCMEGDIRLVDGSHENEGRLEICWNEGWGSVCDDVFEENNNAAEVVCRQLGYSSGITFDNAHFGESSFPIKMDDVNCTGSEENLLQCQFSTVHDCLHKEDAGVECMNETVSAMPETVDGDIRLVNSAFSSAGRLEIYLNGSWGSVCDDKFNENNNAADVVCRQLGYRHGGVVHDEAYYGESDLPILLDSVICSGHETTILQCAHSTEHDCLHKEDVGVECRLYPHETTVDGSNYNLVSDNSIGITVDRISITTKDGDGFEQGILISATDQTNMNSMRITQDTRIDATSNTNSEVASTRSVSETDHKTNSLSPPILATNDTFTVEWIELIENSTYPPGYTNVINNNATAVDDFVNSQTDVALNGTTAADNYIYNYDQSRTISRFGKENFTVNFSSQDEAAFTLAEGSHFLTSETYTKNVPRPFALNSTYDSDDSWFNIFAKDNKTMCIPLTGPLIMASEQDCPHETRVRFTGNASAMLIESLSMDTSKRQCYVYNLDVSSSVELGECDENALWQVTTATNGEGDYVLMTHDGSHVLQHDTETDSLQFVPVEELLSSNKSAISWAIETENAFECQPVLINERILWTNYSVGPTPRGTYMTGTILRYTGMLGDEIINVTRWCGSNGFWVNGSLPDSLGWSSIGLSWLSLPFIFMLLYEI